MNGAATPRGKVPCARSIVMQRKTQRPVQFEITPTTREAVDAWIKAKGLKGDSFLLSSRVRAVEHLGTRQYARIVLHWMDEIGLDTPAYGTHSLRRWLPSCPKPRCSDWNISR